jgi:hypothetical protein
MAEITKTPESPRRIVPIVLLALLSGSAGGGVSYLLQRYDASSEQHPKIAIIDVTSLARDLPKEGEVATIVDRRVKSLRASAEKLRDAGWIILDSQAVFGAPESLYIPYETNK